MKKLLMILSASLICAGATATTTFAQEGAEAPATRQSTDVTTDTEVSVPVTRTIVSAFSVMIPQSIDFAADSDVSAFTVKVKGNITAKEEIVITLPAEVDITAEKDTAYTKKAQVALDTKTFKRDVLSMTEYKDVAGSITFNETKADTYKGNVAFNVALKPIVAPIN